MIVWVQVPSPALIFFERGRLLRTGLLIVNAKIIRLKGAGVYLFKPDFYIFSKALGTFIQTYQNNN